MACSTLTKLCTGPSVRVQSLVTGPEGDPVPTAVTPPALPPRTPLLRAVSWTCLFRTSPVNGAVSTQPLRPLSGVFRGRRAARGLRASGGQSAVDGPHSARRSAVAAPRWPGTGFADARSQGSSPVGAPVARDCWAICSSASVAVTKRDLLGGSGSGTAGHGVPGKWALVPLGTPGAPRGGGGRRQRGRCIRGPAAGQAPGSGGRGPCALAGCGGGAGSRAWRAPSPKPQPGKEPEPTAPEP